MKIARQTAVWLKNAQGRCGFRHRQSRELLEKNSIVMAAGYAVIMPFSGTWVCLANWWAGVTNILQCHRVLGRVHGLGSHQPLSLQIISVTLLEPEAAFKIFKRVILDTGSEKIFFTLFSNW